MLTVFFSITAAQGMGQTIGAAFMDVKKAMTLASVILVTFMLSGGFFIQKVPSFMSWVRYLSFNYHTYKLLLNIQYSCSDGSGCHPPVIRGLTLDSSVTEVAALAVMVLGGSGDDCSGISYYPLQFAEIWDKQYDFLQLEREPQWIFFSSIQVLILSERLHVVTSQFDQLRAIRFQEAINRAMPRRKLKRASNSQSIDQPKPMHVTNEEITEAEPTPQRVQQQLLDDETRALQAELTGLLDAAQQTETKMVEMSALNHLMSTHVLQQAQQIEALYDQAVEATTNVTLGNKELSQAIQRNSSSRTFLLLFLFVLTFSVLFLDWYS